MIFDLGPSIQAAMAAAQSIYHRVLAVNAAVTEWRHDNPAISHLIDEGTALATEVLMAHGVPVAAIEQIGAVLPKMIAASLAGMAAADATVVSGVSVSPPTAPAALPPAQAPAVAQAAPVQPVAMPTETATTVGLPS